LLNKIKANGVYLDKDNNSGSIIASAKWLKKIGNIRPTDLF